MKKNLFFILLIILIAFSRSDATTDLSANESGTTNYPADYGGNTNWDGCYVGATSNAGCILNCSGASLNLADGVYISYGTANNQMVFNGNNGFYSCTISSGGHIVSIGNNYGYGSGNNNLLELTNGAIFYVYAPLYIGGTTANANSNSLVITDNSSWYNYSANGTNTIIGLGSSYNSIVVSGNSLFDSAVSIYLGYTASANAVSNSITVSGGSKFQMNGADLFVGLIGNGWTTYGNSVNVEGSGSTFSAGEMFIGCGNPYYLPSYSYSNSLNISNGGLVSVADLFIGDDAYDNTVFINNGTLICTNAIYLGYGYEGNQDYEQGDYNIMILTNGASCSATNIQIGYYGSDNTLLVESNSTLNVNGSMTIGNHSVGNVVFVNAGGTINITGNLIIGTNSNDYNSFTIDPGGHVNANSNSTTVSIIGSDNSLIVNGGSLTTAYQLSVNSGNYNLVLVTNGGTLSFVSTITEGDNGNDNNITVTGSKSIFSAGTTYCGGNTGTGIGNTIIISDQGEMSINGTLYCGNQSGSSSNAITVTGSNSYLKITNGFINIGYYGNNNNLTISSGGSVICSQTTYIGYQSTSYNNTVIITDAALTNNGYTIIGNEGYGNNLTINSSGTVSDVIGFLGYSSSAFNNSVIVNDSLWTNFEATYVGYGGSGNSLTINNGGIVQAGTFIGCYLGYQNNSSNNSIVVTDNGSLLTTPQNFYVGYEGSANTLIITNGGVVIDSNGYVGYSASSTNNNVYIYSDSIWSNSGNLFIGMSDPTNSTGQGNVYFNGSNGGTIYAQDIYIGSSSSTNSLNFSGGTVHANAIHLAGLPATIRFTGSDDVSADFAIVGTGQVIINGDRVTFNRSNSYAGLTEINSGAAIAATASPFGTSHVFLGVANSSTPATLKVNSNIVASIDYLTINNQASTVQLDGDAVLSLNTLEVNSNVNASISYLRMIGSSNTIQLDGNAIVSIGTFQTSNNPVTVILEGWSISNDPDEKIRYATFDGDKSTNNFTTPSLVGLSKIITDSSVSFYAREDANLIAYVNVFQTNQLKVNSYTAALGGTTTISSAVTITAKESINITAGGAIALAGGQLTTPKMIIDPLGTLLGNGTVNANLTNAGTMAPSGATTGVPGTITINGDYLQTSAGTLAIAIDSTGNSKVIVNGNATFNGGLTVNVASNTPVAYGDYYQIVDLPSGSLSENFTRVTLNGLDNKLWRIRDPLPGITIYLAPVSYTLVAQNQNQSNVATALNSFIPVTSGDELTVSTALDQLTASQYPTAFNQIMPSLYQSLSTIAFNQANGLNMELIQRLWGARIAGSGFSMNGFDENIALIQEPKKKEEKNDLLRPGAQSPWGVFLDGNGIFSQANSGGSLATYNTESGGVTTGLTYQWNEHAVSGLYSGYQGNYTKFNGTASGSLISDSVLFGLFGSYALEKEKGFFVDGLIGGGYGGYTMQRNINFSTISRTATGNPGSGMLNAMAATGYDFKKGKWTYGPTMNLQYAYFGVPSFNETGAGSLDLQNVSWNTSSMIYSLGSHVAYCWEVNKQWVLVPQLNLSWQHEFLQNSYDISANLGGINFNNTSSAPLRDTLYTGIGFSLEFEKKWNASFFYNAAAGNSDLMSQNIFLSLGMRF